MKSKMMVDFDYANEMFSHRREGKIPIHDGMTRLVSDRSSVELFEFLKIPYKEIGFRKKVFQSLDKSLYIVPDQLDASIEMKGGFFNLPKWNDRFNKITQYLTDKGVSRHFTRLDLAFTTDENLFHLFKQSDFKKLLVKSFSRHTNLESVLSSNSRFDATFYDKDLQLKSVRNESYKETFKKKYKDFEKTYRLEFRLKGKDTLNAIPSLMDEKINLKKVATEFLVALEKRIGLHPELLTKIKQTVDEIE